MERWMNNHDVTPIISFVENSEAAIKLVRRKAAAWFERVDQDMLSKQKETLVEIRANRGLTQEEYEALSGIIHLIDGIQTQCVWAEALVKYPHTMRKEEL